MKRLVILLLTVLTIGTAALCGCDGTMTYSQDKDAESVQIETVEDEQPTPEEPDDDRKDRKCPDDKCPHARRPHKRHDKRLPRPKSAYIKHN